MATARIALSSIMDTVSQTANSVSALINVTTKGVGMLDAVVTKVSNEQRLRHKADAEVFKTNIIREYSEAEATANLQVIQFCNKSPDHKQLFETAFNRFSELLNDSTSPKPSE